MPNRGRYQPHTYALICMLSMTATVVNSVWRPVPPLSQTEAYRLRRSLPLDVNTIRLLHQDPFEAWEIHSEQGSSFDRATAVENNGPICKKAKK